ncbi:thiamine diphosphokinase [uncultured Salipiger sp.]|uniref:thiamine diphosphokinase n=1 Tax=uncultured Salipiger sp. TaxID=499810 RepID=UPI00259907ED|nr:thiamine diphosphokinase [uncultured Salipiger sp.]
MNESLISHPGPVLLVGGGKSDPDQLRGLLDTCALRVAADGGAETLLALGVMPDAVIGDLDSLTDASRTRIPAERVHHIPEQNSTDFDKCLRNITAPLVYGTGFLGSRVDHQLAALTVLANRPDRRCILLGEEDVIALAPPEIELSLPVATRLSLYPLATMRGESEGLRWPLGGIEFSPARRVGTSNETSETRVRLRFDAPAMLIILPVEAIPALSRGLLSAPATWPAHA